MYMYHVAGGRGKVASFPVLHHSYQRCAGRLGMRLGGGACWVGREQASEERGSRQSKGRE